MYIHERDNWPHFYWHHDTIEPMLRETERKIGHLFGRLEALGIETQQHAQIDNMVDDVVRSSEIEGIALNADEVRSSVARHLGLDAPDSCIPSRRVDALVSVMLRATSDYASPITHETLFGWQSALFESGYAGGIRVEVGRYRSCPEQIVSGAFGRERVHYIAPSPERVLPEMEALLRWYNTPSSESEIIRSAIAHLWLVSIHPFEDGNGRVSRMLAEVCLARADRSAKRYYSIAASINHDKRNYYRILEQTQSGTCDITEWLCWYLIRLQEAVSESEQSVDRTLTKAHYWERHGAVVISERQRALLNMWLDGYDAKIMSRTWAHLAHCSSDTATRDLQDLVAKGLLTVEDPTAKRYIYRIDI